MSQPTTGGTARCVVQLAASAASRGIDVTVACPAAGGLHDMVRAAGATWVEVDMQRAPSPLDLRHVATVRRLARGSDVVHLHSSKAGAVGRLALRSLGTSRPPCVFTPHGWSWQSGGPLTGAYRAFERRAARWTDAIVAVSEEERDAGASVLGEAPIEVIQNGVDVEHFAPDGARAPRPAEPLLVCVGRLAPPKAQDVAIRALAAMSDRTARLRLVGDGPDRPALVELVGDLGLVDRVELIGEVADAAPHLRAADVLVMPSHSEGQSLAMLEAMACGTPVVTTAVAGSGAVGDTGRIVPVGDHRAMAVAVDELLADRDALADLGRRARARAVAEHDVHETTARNIAVWERLARPSVGRTC